MWCSRIRRWPPSRNIDRATGRISRGSAGSDRPSSNATPTMSSRSSRIPELFRRRLDCDGGEVLIQERLVLRVGDQLTEVEGLLQMELRLLPVAGHEVRPGERLVSERQLPVADVVLLADPKARFRVEERRLGATDDGVGAGDLPFSAVAVCGGADLAPVEPRGMSHVE